MAEESSKPTADWEARYRETQQHQQRLAEALTAAEERFNVLFRESSDLILMLNNEGKILSANHGFEQYTGFTAEQWFHETKSWPDCVHPDDWPALQHILTAPPSDSNPLIEVRLLSHEDFYQWFELSLNTLQNESGQPRGRAAVARNIHRRKEREIQLREQAESMQKRHQRAQLLIAKLKHFFSRLSALPSDIDGYLGGVCHILSDMYGPHTVCIQVLSEAEKHYHAGRHGDQIDAHFTIPATLLAALRQTGLPVYTNNLQDTPPYNQDAGVAASRLTTFLGAPLRDSTGTIRGTLSIVDTEKHYYDNVDVELITVAALHLAARLRAEEQEAVNRELSDHLRQAQKMEAVGTLAGGIAHDFNNILSGILGFSSYLLSKVEDQPDIHRDLKLIEQSAVRAADLTRQLLAFARRRHFAKQAVAMNSVIEEVLSLIRRSFDKRITIEAALADELPMVRGDPGQLNQVIMNLCLNAADAMSEQDTGILRIHTEHRPLHARERHVLTEDSDEPFVCLTVSDTGVGMTPELQEHIYEPFYTTKTDRGGTGLGLSIVYGIVTNHNGHIIVDSERGGGTMFTLYFPVYYGTAEPEARDETGGIAGHETVMVVDDEPIVRQMVTEILKGQGYQVVTAESGEEAIGYLKELTDRIDIVLLDMIMPGMDGEATFKALRALSPDLPVMLTSGYVQEEKSERLINAGALGLIYKPYKAEALLRRLRRALDGASRVPRD
jgi:PAS domain S-box-containing protein